jgi:hypothetical protein
MTTQDFVGKKVVINTKDGSRLLEDYTGELRGIDELGVILAREFRKKMQLLIFPWGSIYKISPAD